MTRALISVSDKTGLVDFARALHERGIELVSTGGTSRAIAEAGLPVSDVSDLTGVPEMMDGRVKTLHPKVHGGLLAIRENPEHEAAMLAHGIAPIDLLVVNLYPFEATVAKGAGYDECIENIDIGGPAMIRGAAKNHADVAVVVDVADYALVLDALGRNDGATDLALRKWLAQKAYARTAAYDAAISNWFAATIGETAPDYRALGGKRLERDALRRKPAPSGGLLQDPRDGAPASRLHGRCRARSCPTTMSTIPTRLSNAWRNSMRHAPPPSRSSNTPIPAASPRARALREAYEKALRCDPVSAFGGIVALNRKLDAEAAGEIIKIFTEVIIAPDADDAAIALVASKKNLRLLLTGGLPDPRAAGLVLRTVAGGMLVQSRDNAVVDDMDLKVVTKRAPTERELADLKFAFRVAKHVKSNAIVYAKDGATVGIGAGQMSRVDSSRIAAWKAAEAAKAAGLPTTLAKGSVVASDAFFPFADGLLAAAEAGATAVIQPGGSMRDDEVIKAADAAGLAMVLTGHRHFRH